MKLDQQFSFEVTARDKLENSITVIADYPHTPQKCSMCKEFGHLPLCCPQATFDHVVNYGCLMVTKALETEDSSSGDQKIPAKSVHKSTAV